MSLFINYYRCPGNLDYRRQHDPVEWVDEWSCACNDKCPECNAEIEPYDFDELDVALAEWER